VKAIAIVYGLLVLAVFVIAGIRVARVILHDRKTGRR
jgi:hypothetical protein